MPSRRKIFLHTIGFIGIDNAGKTSIIDIFSKQKLTKTIPTVGINLEQMSFTELAFDLNILDMGGQKNFRLLWVDYLNTVDVILYVIDASDHERLDETLKEFHKMLILTEINPVPVLVLLNKIDLQNTMDSFTIGERFAEFTELTNRDWNIIETSAVTTKGLIEMFKWIYSKITSRVLEIEPEYKETADKRYFSPCPLLLKLDDGNYCINHDDFLPIKVVPLDTLFTDNFNNAAEVIQDTIEEFDKIGSKVCFNSIYVTEDDDIIHCSTDATNIEVEGVTANKEEYTDSHNMMQLTGGVFCSECLFKILFSALKRKIKAGIKLNIEDIEEAKEVESRRPTDLSEC